ncbi:MAG: hypothetical protein MZV65_44530 [Chromatiales bacterium]|nr:hypothetical protein [Chromatiales bacterium]
MWHMHQPDYRDHATHAGPGVHPALGLSARDQGLRRHGGAPGGATRACARGGELRAACCWSRSRTTSQQFEAGTRSRDPLLRAARQARLPVP